MRKIRLLVTLLCLFWGIIPALAQSVTIVKDMKEVQMASVLAMYKNEFGSFEKPALSDPFPYAVIRMHLEGNAHAVRLAKERLTLYMGQQTGVEARVTTYSNQILFLVRSRRPIIYVDCGDGCEQVMLSNMQKLKSNCLYDCTVRFRPEEAEGSADAHSGMVLYPYKLRVTPPNAQVMVVANGVKQEWILNEGTANLNLLEGEYQYTITAPEHFDKTGTLTVDAEHRDTTIALLSKYGWLNVELFDSTLMVEVQRIGAMAMNYPLPVLEMRCVPGTYILAINKPKHLPWTDTVEVKAGEYTFVTPQLVHKKQKKEKPEDTHIASIADLPKHKGNDAPRTTHTLVLAEVGLAKNPEWGVGLMFGQMYRGVGWYLKGRSNFTFQSDVTGEIGSVATIPDCKSGKSSEWLLDVGIVFDMFRGWDKKVHNSHLGGYVGAGYGARTRYLETFDYGWQKYLPNSYSGLSVDAGVIGSIHGFTLSAGVNTIGFKYMEIELGIGWTF